MLKTNKEIEKGFDEKFVYTDKDDENGIVPRKSWRPTFQLPDRETDDIKAFIRQTRIADLEEMERMVKDKITSHYFDGSCCYNNNENGKGHPECRYPYNPGKTEPKGEQCLKLKEEHFSDFIQKVKEEVFA